MRKPPFVRRPWWYHSPESRAGYTNGEFYQRLQAKLYFVSFPRPSGIKILRVIHHLYEANFSLLLGVKWCRFILHSLQHEIINQSIMLPKEHNNKRIHHIEVIHLYEADLSLLLGVKWHRFILHSLHHEIINQSQYGGLWVCPLLANDQYG
jgi:hypothetical protein